MQHPMNESIMRFQILSNRVESLKRSVNACLEYSGSGCIVRPVMTGCAEACEDKGLFCKNSQLENCSNWKTVSTGKRSQIMELRKPTGEAANDLPAFENPRNLELGKEPVTIKSGMILECGTIRSEESK